MIEVATSIDAFPKGVVRGCKDVVGGICGWAVDDARKLSNSSLETGSTLSTWVMLRALVSTGGETVLS